MAYVIYSHTLTGLAHDPIVTVTRTFNDRQIALANFAIEATNACTLYCERWQVTDTTTEHIFVSDSVSDAINNGEGGYATQDNIYSVYFRTE